MPSEEESQAPVRTLSGLSEDRVMWFRDENQEQVRTESGPVRTESGLVRTRVRPSEDDSQAPMRTDSGTGDNRVRP